MIKFTEKVADKIGIMQSGYTNVYALYILVYLCAILAVSYFLI